MLFQQNIVGAREAELASSKKELESFSTKMLDIQKKMPEIGRQIQDIEVILKRKTPMVFQEKEAELWWKYPLLRKLTFVGNMMYARTETIFMPLKNKFYRAGMYDIEVEFREKCGLYSLPVRFSIPAEDPDARRLCPIKPNLPQQDMHPHIIGIPDSTNICWGRTGTRTTEDVLSKLIMSRNVDAVLHLLFKYLQNYGSEATPYRKMAEAGTSFPVATRRERSEWLNKALALRGLPPLTPEQEKMDMF